MKIKNKRITCIITLYTIIVIGLIMIYSSSHVWANYLYNDSFYYLKRQLLFVVLGTILFIIGLRININFIQKYTKLFLFISLFLLTLVLFIGVSKNGSKSWFGIGTFLFQPSELFKIAIVFYIANKLSLRYLESKKFWRVVIPLVIPAIIGFALIMLEPDFGSGLVMLCSVCILMFLSKTKIKNFIIIGIIGIIAAVILVLFASYRIERISAYLNPWADPLGSGLQIIQSLYAISPGSILGRGFDASIQKYFFLPEPQTDFIFAIFAEEFGLIGGIILLLLYFLLIDNSLVIASNETNEYLSLVKIGFISLIAIQVVINLGVVTGLLPVTGITLPFVSYGGTSFTILMFSMGIILNNRGEKCETFISR